MKAASEETTHHESQLSSAILKQELLTSTATNPEQEKPLIEQSQGKTSLKAATFAMMAAALGTGIFNLPQRITEIGIAVFVVYVMLAGGFSYLGCVLLQRMIVAKGFTSYGDLCEAAFGAPLKRLLQFCIILFPWGIAVCFQVIMPKFILQLLADIFNLSLYENRDKEIYNATGSLLRIVLNLVIICLDFFLIQLRDITRIQKLAVIGVCSVAFNAVVIFVLMGTGFVHHGDTQVQYHGIFQLDWSIIQWAIFEANAFSTHTQALASILFCYINHQLVFPTCKNLDNPTPKRLNLCFLRSNVSEFVLYIIIGLSGYLLLMEHQDILPIGSLVVTSIDVWPMLVGKALMVVTLFLAVPLNLFPARTILHEALNLEKTTKNHYILSVSLASSSCLVAILFVSVNSYFGLLGGTAGVFIGGSIPALCYWKLIMKQSPNRPPFSQYLMLAFISIITVIAFIGGILSVIMPA